LGEALFTVIGASAGLSSSTRAAECPEIDAAVEEAAVRKAEEEFASALSSGDVDRVVSLLAEDVVLITK
jgi:hypothetical protein